MKIQKYLSQAGVCSRRKAEEYIASGLITVNGVRAHIGQVIDPHHDEVRLDDQVVMDQERLVYYACNKPRGVVTTCASSDRDTGLMDIIDIPQRVFPIGRLDKDTNGLILLTNDGRLSNYLIHPRYQHQKEYIVEVYGKIEDTALDLMRRGVQIELKESSNQKKNTPMSIEKRFYRTKPCQIERLSSSRFSIILEEGKNRQIRRMVEAVGHDVKKLKRIRIENIRLGDLREGEYRELTTAERTALFDRIGLVQGIDSIDLV